MRDAGLSWAEDLLGTGATMEAAVTIDVKILAEKLKDDSYWLGHHQRELAEHLKRQAKAAG